MFHYYSVSLLLRVNKELRGGEQTKKTEVKFAQNFFFLTFVTFPTTKNHHILSALFCHERESPEREREETYRRRLSRVLILRIYLRVLQILSVLLFFDYYY